MLHDTENWIRYMIHDAWLIIHNIRHSKLIIQLYDTEYMNNKQKKSF